MRLGPNTILLSVREPDRRMRQRAGHVPKVGGVHLGDVFESVHIRQHDDEPSQEGAILSGYFGDDRQHRLQDLFDRIRARQLHLSGVRAEDGIEVGDVLDSVRAEERGLLVAEVELQSAAYRMG